MGPGVRILHFGDAEPTNQGQGQLGRLVHGSLGLTLTPPALGLPAVLCLVHNCCCSHSNPPSAKSTSEPNMAARVSPRMCNLGPLQRTQNEALGQKPDKANTFPPPQPPPKKKERKRKTPTLKQVNWCLYYVRSQPARLHGLLCPNYFTGSEG